MIFLLLIHTALGLAGSVFLYLSKTPEIAFAFLAGAGLSFLNLAAIVISWPFLLAKKLVALSIGVIVFKFAILGWILYEVVHSDWLNIGWFAAGIATVVLSVCATSLKTSRFPPKNVA